eukprot:TRINITY_DN6343_c0_g1_i1.p2 TRINITY_DN6343_c0_g1~~TRINITY_DN6343_c0_g1_i1.p2  ORF type:complete len:277 (-),score=-18.73 TRINITY_DN6343_c0_g1_i1:374-1162(-)
MCILRMHSLLLLHQNHLHFNQPVRSTSHNSHDSHKMPQNYTLFRSTLQLDYQKIKRYHKTNAKIIYRRQACCNLCLKQQIILQNTTTFVCMLFNKNVYLQFIYNFQIQKKYLLLVLIQIHKKYFFQYQLTKLSYFKNYLLYSQHECMYIYVQIRYTNNGIVDENIAKQNKFQRPQTKRYTGQQYVPQNTKNDTCELDAQKQKERRFFCSLKKPWVADFINQQTNYTLLQAFYASKSNVTCKVFQLSIQKWVNIKKFCGLFTF